MSNTKQLNVISEQQLAILGYLRLGLTNSQMAVVLDLSDHTIKDHLRRLSKKFGAKSRTDLNALVITVGPAREYVRNNGQLVCVHTFYARMPQVKTAQNENSERVLERVDCAKTP